MEVEVSGYRNNRPVLTTYRILEVALAIAVAKPEFATFDVEGELGTRKQYALKDNSGDFAGMIMYFGTSAMLTTINSDAVWKPGAELQIHGIEELDSKLDY